MRLSLRRLSAVLAVCLLSLTGLTASSSAQSSPVAALRPVVQANRVPVNADFGPQTQLARHIPAWISPASQVAQPLNLQQVKRVTVLLNRAPAVEAAFQKLLADQQNPSSPLYHEWLTPQQIGDLYGPSAADYAAVTGWLASQGLTLDSAAPSHVMLEVSGTMASLSSAFRTSFGYFSLGDEARISAITEPSVPTVLVPLIKGIGNLTEVPFDPQNRRTGPQQFPAGPQAANGSVQPQYTNGNNHYIVPADFNTIYDSASVLTGGNTGATIVATGGATVAQHIAIIGRARVPATSISEFAANTGLASGAYTEVVATTGADPGPACTQANYSTCATAGDEGEAVLDVERVIGTANGAKTDLVISSTFNGQDGVYIAAAYNVNTLLDPIMTISFGSCEVRNGPTNTATFDTLFTTAAAEGISVFVSSGDSGAAGCDRAFSNPPAVTAQYAISPNVICVSASATCVGGTLFNEGSNTYWNTTNAANRESAISYIPEAGWNEPTTTNTSSGYWPASSGGGASLYISKPTWQTGTGVPVDGARDTPDVAFSGSGHDSYYLCQDDALGPYITAGQIKAPADCTTADGGYFFGSYGTSAAAPGMAGLAALINTKLGKAQGNMNPLLYKIAAATPAAFHDTTVASSGVTGCAVATPSACNNSIPGSASLTVGAQAGYLVGTGYDEVTGLGSLDVQAFLNAAIATVSTTLAVTDTPNPSAAGAAVTLTATLTPSSSTLTPTGTVQFYSAGAAIGTAQTLAANKATLSYTFVNPGTYAVTAVYSGDANFSTSTSTAVSQIVSSAPTFSIVPATTTVSLVSGATTGNTVNVTTTSLNSFAGTVALTCAVANASGTAAGTCAVVPNAATLTSGTNSMSVLTINSTAGTSGTLSVTVTGVSGATTITSPAITVTLAASGLTATANPTTLAINSGATTGNTSAITVTSTNGFAGPVTLTCAASGTAAGSCSVLPATVTLTAGGTATATVTLTTTAGTSGTVVATVTASGTTTGATIAAVPATATVTATLTAAGLTETPAPGSLAIISGATTGNTSALTITSTNGFAGVVTPTCAVVATGTAAGTCSILPATVTLTAGGTASATLTLATTPGTSGTLTTTVTARGTTAGATAAATPATAVVTATLTASSLTAVVTGATSATVLSGASTASAVTVTSVNGFAGPVTLACVVTNVSGSAAGSCSATPVTLTAGGTGISTVTLLTTFGSGGVYNAVVTATGTTTGATLSTSATAAPIVITVTPPTFAITGSAPSLTFTSGAVTGNSETLTLASANGFAGTVALTCSVSASSAANQPTCALVPTSVTLTAGGTATTVATITTVTAHSASGGAQASLRRTFGGGGAMFALLVCLLPFRKRRLARSLMVLVVLLGSLAAMSGCGGGGTAPKVLSSSAGNYVVTVSGTGTPTGSTISTTSSATFTLTVN